jgi:ribosomal protein L9
VYVLCCSLKSRTITNWNQPQRSLDLLAVLLPSKLEFFRPVIEVTEQEQNKNLPKEITDILHQSGVAGPVAIYGSVSTTDIANNIKDYVAYNDEASRVTLSDNDIRFVGLSELEETTRVKHLGEYEIEISIKGTEGRVKRKVLVIAQEKDQQLQEEPKNEA